MSAPSAQAQGEIIREGYPPLSDVFQRADGTAQYRATLTNAPSRHVLFDAVPFASGGQRLAFHGELYSAALAPDERVMPVVIKFDMATDFSVRLSRRDRLAVAAEQAKRAVRVQESVARFAARWQADFRMNKAVHVLDVHVVKVGRIASALRHSNKRPPANVTADVLPVPQVLPLSAVRALQVSLLLDSVVFEGAVGTVEPFVQGRFTKFVNNDGAAARIGDMLFPSAFVHWSWIISRRALMLTDMQGVRTNRKYILTDPGVHSTERYRRSCNQGTPFGPNDLGILGIRRFLSKHVCNALCVRLGLPLSGSSGFLPRVLQLRASREAMSAEGGVDGDGLTVKSTMLVYRSRKHASAGGQPDSSWKGRRALRGGVFGSGFLRLGDPSCLIVPRSEQDDGDGDGADRGGGCCGGVDEAEDGMLPYDGARRRLGRLLSVFSKRSNLKDVMQASGRSGLSCREQSEVHSESGIFAGSHTDA